MAVKFQVKLWYQNQATTLSNYNTSLVWIIKNDPNATDCLFLWKAFFHSTKPSFTWYSIYQKRLIAAVGYLSIKQDISNGCSRKTIRVEAFFPCPLKSLLTLMLKFGVVRKTYVTLWQNELAKYWSFKWTWI